MQAIRMRRETIVVASAYAHKLPFMLGVWPEAGPESLRGGLLRTITAGAAHADQFRSGGHLQGERTSWIRPALWTKIRSHPRGWR